LVVEAGNATSTRLRDEEQSFNRIDIDGDGVTLTVQGWAEDGFKSADAQQFIREGDSWRLAGADHEMEESAH